MPTQPTTVSTARRGTDVVRSSNWSSERKHVLWAGECIHELVFEGMQGLSVVRWCGYSRMRCQVPPTGTCFNARTWLSGTRRPSVNLRWDDGAWMLALWAVVRGMFLANWKTWQNCPHVSYSLKARTKHFGEGHASNMTWSFEGYSKYRE